MRTVLLTLSLTLVAAGCATSLAPRASLAALPATPPAEAEATPTTMRCEPARPDSDRRSDDPFGTYRGHVGPYRHGDLSILLGVRSMQDDSSWGPVRDQLAGGLVWTFEPEENWVGFDASFFYSADSADLLTGPNTTARVRGETYELSMGAVKSLLLGGSGLRIYFGAGGALVSARLGRVENGLVLEGNDNSFGVYGRAGLVYHIGQGGFIGFDYRHLGATDADVLGLSFDSDYDQLTFHFGTSF